MLVNQLTAIHGRFIDRGVDKLLGEEGPATRGKGTWK